MPPAAAGAGVAAGAAAGTGAAAAGGIGASLATGATIAGGLATTGAGLAQIFGGQAGVSGQRLELPPELEEIQLDRYTDFLAEIENDVKQTRELIPFIKQRVDLMDKQVQQATPDPSVIKELNDLDKSIADRFGKEIAKDVQAGIITRAAKDQAIELQSQIAEELRNQGKQVDESLLTDIQEQIRKRLSPTSPESVALEQVRTALMEEVQSTGDVIRRNPLIERELEEQKQALNNELAQRGIDPNSTAGRRAMQEFAQRATETRFNVSEQLQQGRIARLGDLNRLVLENVSASDIARSTSLAQTRELQTGFYTQDSQRRQRLSEIGTLIQSPLQANLLAGEEDRLREQQNVQRAQVALGASQQQRSAFERGITNQAELLKLQQLPVQLRARILESQGAGLSATERLGAQKFSDNTKRLLQQGGVSGILPRTAAPLSEQEQLQNMFLQPHLRRY